MARRFGGTQHEQGVAMKLMIALGVAVGLFVAYLPTDSFRSADQTFQSEM